MVRPGLQLPVMGFYDEQPPRHGHRNPSELAEDEMLSAVHGDFCGMPEAPEQPRSTGETICVPISPVALLPWADAHPFTATPVKQPYGGAAVAAARARKPAPTPKPMVHRDNDDS